TICLFRRIRFPPIRACTWIQTMSSADSMFRGTSMGGFSIRWTTLDTESAWIVEYVTWPVLIAWKSVWHSLPRTSPTMIYSGRCRIAARRSSYMLISPRPAVSNESRVTLGIQLGWGSFTSRVSSRLTIFAIGGMKREIAFNDVIGRGDRLVLEFTDGEGGSMGGYFLPECHLDTGTIGHGGIENRFSNGDILAGTLGEFCDKRVELLCIVVHQRGLHRFVTGMEGK